MKFPNEFVNFMWSLGALDRYDVPKRIKARANAQVRTRLKKRKDKRLAARKVRRITRLRCK